MECWQQRSLTNREKRKGIDERGFAEAGNAIG
jgi:hypothetical protein